MTRPACAEDNVRSKPDQLVPDSGKRKRSNRDERKADIAFGRLYRQQLGGKLTLRSVIANGS